MRERTSGMNMSDSRLRSISNGHTGHVLVPGAPGTGTRRLRMMMEGVPLSDTDPRYLERWHETLEMTPEIVRSWVKPKFQRYLNAKNKKMPGMMEEYRRNGGVVSGNICFGVVNGKWLQVDGQYRCQAWLESGVQEGYAEADFYSFDPDGADAEMGKLYVRLNEHIQAFATDAVLRGLEESNVVLASIRKECPFVGYTNVRRGGSGVVVQMASVLRCWRGSAFDFPAPGGLGALDIAKGLGPEEARDCIRFLTIAQQAWRGTEDYGALWRNVNMCLCMWLYRRIVLSGITSRVKINEKQFCNCMMELTVERHAFLAYLKGRTFNDRDRSGTYFRIKDMFGSRIRSDTGRKPMLPAPEWASHQSRPTILQADEPLVEPTVGPNGAH